MSEFLAAAFAMPTAVFSCLLIAIGVYWLTVIFGLFDLEILDGLFDLFDAADAVDGVDGVAEAVDGGGDGGGCLGLAGIPLSIIGSVIVFFAWGFSYGGVKLFPSLVLGTATAAAFGVGAFALALAVTAVALRPFRKVFRIARGTGRKDLVGRVCVVKTLRVDDKFGQAEVEDEGAAILIQARCVEANELARGSQALIFDYDAEREVFYIVALDSAASQLAAPSRPPTG